MKLKKRYHSTYAVSGVIEALLLVALATIVISTIQLTYIPQVMNDREAQHMDEVSNQFSHFKAVIDIQAITQSTAPISSPLTLGSTKLPYFITQISTGDVSIKDDQITLVITPGLAGLDMGTITYTANNLYYKNSGEDVKFILEAGGIIRGQQSGSSWLNNMLVDPIISIDNSSSITIDFTFYNIIGVEGKNYTEHPGFQNNVPGKCFIRTNFSHSTTYSTFNDITSIKIYTDYTNAWNNSLHRVFGNTVDIVEVPSENPVYVYITPNVAIGKTVNVDLEIIDIQAQTGPGWVLT